MIPRRVPADFVPAHISGLLWLDPDHLPYGRPCPACDAPMKDEPVVLVPVGIAPRHRDRTVQTIAGTVTVHAACARPLTSKELLDELSRLGQELGR